MNIPSSPASPISPASSTEPPSETNTTETSTAPALHLSYDPAQVAAYLKRRRAEMSAPPYTYHRCHRRIRHHLSRGRFDTPAPFRGLFLYRFRRRDGHDRFRGRISNSGNAGITNPDARHSLPIFADEWRLESSASRPPRPENHARDDRSDEWIPFIVLSVCLSPRQGFVSPNHRHNHKSLNAHEEKETGHAPTMD